MKRNLLCTLALFWLIPAYAQRNEIGMNMVNLPDSRDPFPYWTFGKPQMKWNYANGAIYKKTFGQNALRAGMDFYSKSLHYESGADAYFYFDARMRYGDLRIGYERRLSKGKLQPYIGVDLFFTYGQLKGSLAGSGDIDGRPIAFSFDWRLAEIGVSPVVGVTYKLNKLFTISAEASAGVAISHDFPSNSITETSGRLFYNPLRILALSYTF